MEQLASFFRLKSLEDILLFLLHLLTIVDDRYYHVGAKYTNTVLFPKRKNTSVYSVRLYIFVVFFPI